MPKHNQLSSIQSFVSAGQYNLALEAALTLLDSTDSKLQLYLLIAQIHTLLGQFYPALSYLNLANLSSPSNSVVLFNIGTTFLSLGEPRIAKQYFIRSLSFNSKSVDCLLNLAVAYQRLFQHNKAHDCYQQALQLDHNNSLLCNNFGNCCKHLGLIEDSRAYLLKAIQLNPLYYEAHRNLSLITKYHSDHPHLHQLQSLYDDPNLPEAGRLHLSFALGRAYEMVHQYDTAFSYYSIGNNIKRSTVSYDINHEKHRFQQLLRADTLQSDIPPSIEPQIFSANITPIFIVGMPRSGSTLLETILGMHPNVYPLDELTYLESNLFKYGLKPDLSIDLGPESLAAVSSAYFSDIMIDFPGLPVTGDVFVIDKMPFNFRYANFIARAFPSARILYTTRSPMDNTMSIYRELFTSSNLFSFTTAEISTYLVMQRKLMDQWLARYPGRILEVSYETLVSHPADSLLEICEFVGIDFTHDLLHPERSSRSVTTASSVSARSPINTQSIGKWRHYESHLLPLVDFFNANSVTL